MINAIVASTIVLVVLYFIISEKIDKLIAVSSGALLMIVMGTILGFYSQHKALEAIDFNTLGLLLGMMIVASILKETGFFTYIAISLAKLSKGKPWRLMALLGISTALISMLVDNVTTIIIIGPISILVCDILGINPLPILMAEILLSTIGGTATLVGDPPNIFIGSAANLSFNDFLKNLFPVVAAMVFFSFFILKRIFKRQLSDKPRNFQAIMNIDLRKTIKDPIGMIKCLVILAITFTLFFLHDCIGFYPSFIALFGAGLTFLLLRPKPEQVFRDVEWVVLAFFACFFVIVGGLQETGVLSLIAKKTIFIANVDLKLYKILLLWITGIFSSMIGAVPFTMIMLPAMKTLSVLGVEGASLWWILALGVGFGANGLPIGHAASILGISLSKKSRAPINMKVWLSSATVVTVASLMFVSILILIGIF